jgi:transposase
LRERVVAAIEAGQTRAKVAELYNMALSTVGGFIKRKRETGSVSPDKFRGYKTFALEPHTALVKELAAEQPDNTLAELQVRLAKEEVNVSQSGISRFLHHINPTFKKANGSSIRCHTATGKQRLSYAGRALITSSPRLCWMAQ